jgi:hypothetical protein
VKAEVMREDYDDSGWQTAFKDTRDDEFWPKGKSDGLQGWLHHAR